MDGLGLSIGNQRSEDRGQLFFVLVLVLVLVNPSFSRTRKEPDGWLLKEHVSAIGPLKSLVCFLTSVLCHLSSGKSHARIT